MIDPLFLDELRAELSSVSKIASPRTRNRRLKEFQEKLSRLTFLDPACGSGNFLTETYISLRRLENEALSLLHSGQIVLDFGSPVKVSIGQFFGIEIDHCSATAARTALRIAEHQMIKETKDVVHTSLDFLPVKTYDNIIEGNALRLDWERATPKERLDYIIGNPPFVGYSYQSPEQKEDLRRAAPDTGKNIDYAAGWFFKAARFMKGTKIRSAFVSTSSITQGEQACSVWKPLFEKYHIHIDFAHRAFLWKSEASSKAHVYCVVVGFSFAPSDKPKRLFTSDRTEVANHINAYLLNAPDIFVERRARPLCDIPEIHNGGKPVDGGNLLLSPQEYEELISLEPDAQKYLRPFSGAAEFLKGKKRYCLWLKDVSPQELSKMPEIKERIEAVRSFRLSSKSPSTRKKADAPMLFAEAYEYHVRYLAIPRISSKNRPYIPIGFLSAEWIPSDGLFLIPRSALYHFGILTSGVHMAWIRALCCRLGNDYSYSSTIVYNNFPWPSPTDAQKAKIEKSAQGILNARALYPDASMADLYDRLLMPPELKKAHQANDRAVMEAYGFPAKTTTEADCVAELIRMYQELKGKK